MRGRARGCHLQDTDKDKNVMAGCDLARNFDRCIMWMIKSLVFMASEVCLVIGIARVLRVLIASCERVSFVVLVHELDV